MSATYERVEALDHNAFEHSAAWVATQLRTTRQDTKLLGTTASAIVKLTPGDSTAYLISIVRLDDNGKPRWWVAHQFGPLYEWGGANPVHWTYAVEHFVFRGSASAEHTACVIARFLTTLSPMVHADEANR